MSKSTDSGLPPSTNHIGFLLAAITLLLAGGSLNSASGQCSPQQVSKIVAADAAGGDEFGWTVAISGDTAVVGAPLDDDAGNSSGSAYVFIRTGGSWVQQVKLTASDGAAFDEFGISVAISGDTVVVGSFGDDNVGSSSGSAYVFVRAGTVWSQQAKLTASDAATNDFFGWSVAVSGDTAVIGSYQSDTVSLTDSGSAYVFVRSGTTWSQQAKLAASDAASFDRLGIAVAVAGDTALIGAAYDGNSGGFHAGSAYVFVRSGTVWSQQARLSASDGAMEDQFGWSVAISGDTAIVGSYQDDEACPGNPSCDSGSAYIFVRAGTAWSQQAKIVASDAASLDWFGVSVAVSGDTAMVGARFNDHAAGMDAGAAYVFHRAGTVWTQQSKLIASDAAGFDEFGISVSVSGDNAIVGAWDDTLPSNVGAGSAYVFDLHCNAPVCCAGDFDANNAVTNADIPGFASALLIGAACPGPPACCPGDFNADGNVDGSDIPAFIAKLLSGGTCP